MLWRNQLSSCFNKCSVSSKHFLRILTAQSNIMTNSKESDDIQNSNQGEKRELNTDENEENKKKQKIIEIDTPEPKPFVRIKKRNYAMMLGYLGKNYYGMQRNPGIRTIEDDLVEAMYKANLITEKGVDALQLINFQRAARTDKGVSAVRQVCSLKLPENTEEDPKDMINRHLCEDIRIFDITRVTKGFNSKSQCDSRTYSYTMPTYALASENLELFNLTEEFLDEEKRVEELSVIDGKKFTEFRLPRETWERLNQILKKYEGTKNYHNYTTKLKPLDPSSKRYIISFAVEEPFLNEGMEFITLKVKGQSFMMHQIRKMVSMVIGIIRNIVTEEQFEQSFLNEKICIPRAPSLGLMLNFVHYEFYNKRYGSDGVHNKLEWIECNKEVEDFKEKKILKDVYETELKENSMLVWLAQLRVQDYKPRKDNED